MRWRVKSQAFTFGSAAVCHDSVYRPTRFPDPSRRFPKRPGEDDPVKRPEPPRAPLRPRLTPFYDGEAPDQWQAPEGRP